MMTLKHSGRRLFSTSTLFARTKLQDVVIVSAARTPIGAFRGSLASVPATQLGAVAIKGAIDKAGIKPTDVEDVFMGNVVSAGAGQAPARQAAIYAGIPTSAEATTINKVCASGLKAIIMASQNIALGYRNIMVAGGMESMSNVPYYLMNARSGYNLGNGQLIDGIIHDGLWDVYNNQHMGNCAEETAAKYGITREEQDAHAVASYQRAIAAQEQKLFDNEIVPVTVSAGKGQTTVVSLDDEPKRVKFDKIPSLRSAFQKDGTVTAANSSKLNDGASALILMSAERAKELGVKPIARILGYGDAAQEPKLFTTAPSLAIPKALKMAGVTLNDISLHEINEAFSVVINANSKILGLDGSKVNVRGGAVALGHPIGSSGSRIVVTLINALQSGQLGCASICNGGGAASALVVEKL